MTTGTTTKLRLPKAVASYSVVQIPKTVAGLVLSRNSLDELSYHELIELCRYFYKYDPIAGTVINRMSAMSVTLLRNRWKDHTDAEKIFWDKVAEKIRAFYKTVAIEYFVHGMVIPEYNLTPIMGKKFDQSLGRKRLWFPTELWTRNVDNIIVKKKPAAQSRSIFIKIPQEDIDFVLGKGVWADGTEDKAAYQELIRDFPDYVAAINNSQTYFALPEVNPFMRHLVSYDDYPTPFLRNALQALKHKEDLKKMDRTIANRAINALRHVKIGSDEFPADTDDIAAAQTILAGADAAGDMVSNLYTNHTWEIDWILPPLDVLINDAKYSEPNSDIFLAMGFPRVLTVGETAKSNSSDSKIALLGPISTLSELRDVLTEWAVWLYAIIGEQNDMIPPDPYLTPIPLQDITSLIQFSISARTEKAISRDTIAQLYGTTFEDEALKMKEEEEILKEYKLNQIPGVTDEDGNPLPKDNPAPGNNTEKKPNPGKPKT